eukprot:gene360-475_t
MDAMSGLISTIAGSGVVAIYTFWPNGDDGPATAALLRDPTGILGRVDGSKLFADQTNLKVRVIYPSGIVSLFAGTGVVVTDSSPDGSPATSTGFTTPKALWVDLSNNTYVSESGGHKVRLISPSGIVSTFAGNGVSLPNGAATSGLLGNGGPATSTYISFPEQLFGDSNGMLYITDRGVAGLLRAVRVSTGIISLIAGSGRTMSMSSGAATAIGIGTLSGVYGDSSGMLYLSCFNSYVVRMITPQGFMSVVAGTGTSSTSAAMVGDGGPLTAATFAQLLYTFVNTVGEWFVSDKGNNKIRKLYISPTAQPTPSPTSSPKPF